MRVCLRLLGMFEVTAGGQALSFPTRKTEALLARLARRPGQRVARAALAGLLWPDRPDAQGRGSLRQALAAVRRVLEQAGAEGPTAGADVVCLPAGSVDVDLAALEAELAREAPDPARVAALCRGPLLAGFPPVSDLFDAWLDAERSALARAVVERLRPGIVAAARDGDVAGLRLADAALALDPAFEPAHRARMAVLARGGDRAAALREYERCRTTLARELGVAPGPETEALRRELAAPPICAPAQAPDCQPRRTSPSIAILPFEVRGDAPRDELFARGLSEDLAGALSRFRSLRVLARESVERASARASDGIETARTLGSDYLLSTSARTGGGRMRLSVRLVEAASGRQVWADRFDVEIGAAFEAQDRITRAVAAALAIRIDASELEAALRRPPEALEAHECWLRGMSWLRRGTVEADLEARRLFERALEIEPGFARGFTGLSLSHFNDWSCAAWERWDETERKAYEYALEATRLDDQDHVTHCILGRILLYRREFERGIAHLRRALALNPNDADVLAHACLGHAHYGEPERAIALEQDARELHPFHPDWYLACFGAGRFIARRADEALERFGRCPDAQVDARAYMGAARVHLGDLEGAREEVRRYVARFGRSIAFGAPFAPEDPARWILRVNPLRRAEDRAYLVEALARAGLALPPEAGDGAAVAG